MKIALINNLYKPYNKGGAERVTESLINDWQKLGHSCFLISTKPKNKKEVNENPRTYYLNSEYYNLAHKSFIYRLFWQIANLFNFNFNRRKKLKNILQKEKPDLIISNNLMGIGLWTFRIIKKLGIKHEHILHDVQLFYPSGLIIWGKEKKTKSLTAKIYQAIARRIIGSPDMIISPSRWLLDEHLKRSYFKNSQSQVRPNPINIKKLDKGEELYQEEKKKEESFNFLFVGQIENHKGIIFLIEVFKNFTKEGAKLKIVGSGSLEKKVLQMIAEDKRFEFLGRKDLPALAFELQNSDCLIVPSLCYENSPTIIYEAKVFNLPIIASDLGGIPELINGKQEYLFKAGDKNDLIEKMEKIIQILDKK